MSSFFKRLSTTETHDVGTTKNFFIGTPEAEGETTSNSRIKLGEIFGDYLNVFPELHTEKFIITGRKGAGKSALAEYINYNAHNDANVFCDFIKIRELDSQKLVQLGRDQGLPVEEILLFEWVILTKFIKLLVEDQTVQSIKEFKDLKIFLERNSGLVDIKSYEIAEIVRTKSLDVNIEYFKRVFSAVFKRNIGIKEHKAPFYKILPHLKDIVIKLLKENVAINNEFILIFDDLDIGFKESNLESIEKLTNILRIAKDYNIDYFGKNGLNGKVIVLLRDDIKRVIVKYNADTAKIFSSYEIPLIWYEHENFKTNENAVGLKKLINKRIELNFIKEKIDYNKSDPWTTLFKSDPLYGGSSFKYIIDYTFFKPRDLILIFKSLPLHAFKIPLTYNDTQKLLNSYVEEQINEIKNELSATFTPKDISNIFLALKNLRTKNPMTKEDLIEEFLEVGVEYEPLSTIMHLFNYSIIGNFESSEFDTPKYYFKHRERREDPYTVNFDLQFIYQKCINFYFTNKKN